MSRPRNITLPWRGSGLVHLGIGGPAATLANVNRGLAENLWPSVSAVGYFLRGVIERLRDVREVTNGL